MPVFVPIGAVSHLRIADGVRTPHSRNFEVSNRAFVGPSSRWKTLTTQKVVDYPAEQCFELFRDYKALLNFLLKDNERVARAFGENNHNSKLASFCANPQYLLARSLPLNVSLALKNKKKAQNEPEMTEEEIQDAADLTGKEGVFIKYAYFLDGVSYDMVDKITKIDDGTSVDSHGNKVFSLSVEVCRSTRPEFPLGKVSTTFNLSAFEQDTRKCVITYTKKVKQLKFMSLKEDTSLADMISAAMERELFQLNQFFHAEYSPKLPKNNQRILCIGAGPSTLHMTYELIKRGISPKNFTILEKTDRYGGKTVSLKSNAEKLISNAKYNSLKPPLKNKCELIRLNNCAGRGLSDEELNDSMRKILPGALQEQEDYFEGGEDVIHELGTCYLSPGYYSIRTLLAEVQDKVEQRVDLLEQLIQLGEDVSEEELAKWKAKVRQDITRQVAPSSYAIESSSWKGAYSMEEWIYRMGRKYTVLDDIFGCCQASRVGCVDLTVLEAKVRYCEWHEYLLGNFYYTLPPQPHDHYLPDLLLPFDKFLSDKGLQALVPLFTYGLTAQGYGIIAETPAFLAMQWLTPDLLDGYFEWYEFFNLYKDAAGNILHPIPEHLRKFDNYRKSLLVSGWGSLWDRIVDLYSLNDQIRYNVRKIEYLTRENDKVQIKYHMDDQIITEEYDFLIVGAPIVDHYLDPTQKILNIELTEQESELFVTKDMEAATFRTVLFKPDLNGLYSKEHLRVFIDSILNADANSIGVGDVFAMRDSYKALQPMLSTEFGSMFDPLREEAREKMCYQYVSPDKSITNQELEDKYLKFILAHPDLLKLDNAELNDAEIARNEELKHRILHEMKYFAASWTYYAHYKESGITAGKLWRVLDLQGSNRTLFVHASTNFESVLDIMNYNNMMLDGLSGRLNNLIKPEADSRPDPWERPQNYIFNEVLFYSGIRHFFNALFFFFWAVYYVITYIPAELIYLRRGRYHINKAFDKDGAKLSSWTAYTLKTFVDELFVTKGLKKLLDPSAKMSDAMFEDLKMDEAFKAKLPGIPTSADAGITASIQWNITDFRHAFRFWLHSARFEKNFSPFVGAFIPCCVGGASYFFPNLYSYFFSWVLVSQFRMFFGFSYRFEDEKGGGVYIPDCALLRTAIEQYGVEAGQKICLAGFKVILEESLREHQMQVEFMPAFVENAGYSCVVRMINPRNHAFSDHSIQHFVRPSAVNAGAKVVQKAI